MPAPRPLTEGQRRFCSAYAADPNGAKAYRLAFPEHAPGTARVTAAVLTKLHVRNEIRRLRRGYEKRVQTSADRMNRELKDTALYDPVDAFTPDPAGGPDTPLPLSAMPAAVRRAIVGVKLSVSRGEVTGVEYKFADKLRTNERLGRRLGYDRPAATGRGARGGGIEPPACGRDGGSIPPAQPVVSQFVRGRDRADTT